MCNTEPVCFLFNELSLRTGVNGVFVYHLQGTPARTLHVGRYVSKWIVFSQALKFLAFFKQCCTPALGPLFDSPFVYFFKLEYACRGLEFRSIYCSNLISLSLFISSLGRIGIFNSGTGLAAVSLANHERIPRLVTLIHPTTFPFSLNFIDFLYRSIALENDF